MEFEALSNRVIGFAIEVHKALGPGLLESAYERCLAHELAAAGIEFETQKAIPVSYKDEKLDCGYRADMVVEEQLLLELKSVEAVTPVHEAQVLTYMRLANLPVALLINFNVKLLKDGIRRFVN
jgi:GxxExxY protein